MTHYDYAVLFAYFAFMLVIGWVFRRFVNNISDYFRGGGKAVWWLVGGSAFMLHFSAWTFTGAAGMAYSNGWPIMVIYIGNILGFTIGAIYFAPRFRQLRVITGIEAVRLRFGRASEQVFTWLQLPLGVLQAGIWLYALSKFFHTIFGINLVTTIIAIGAVVLFIALLGGKWGVLASDFIQVLILMPVCLVLTVFALAHVGGFGEFIEKLPRGHTDLSLLFSQKYLALWCFAMLLKQITVSNNLIDANRFLAAKDTRHARRASFLGAALFALGVVIWFIPPMAARILYPDLAAQFPGIGGELRHIEETSFIAIARHTLPAGMMGLLVSGIFAATMSSMDSGLNKTAGIFIRNFYQPILRPNADDRALLRVGKLVTTVLGALIVLVALRMSTWENYSLFLLTQRVSILVSMPILVPLFAGVFIRRTPPWAAWSTVLVGFVVSILMEPPTLVEWYKQVFDIEHNAPTMSVEYWKQSIGMLLIFFVCLAWFAFTSLFWKKTTPAHKAQVALFATRISTPVDFNKEEGSASANDHRQARTIGNLCLPFGAFVTLLALIPNPTPGRIAFLFCGAVPIAVGILLRRSARIWEENARTHAAAQKTILAALAPDELRDFFPDSLYEQLRGTSARLVIWNPAARTTAEFHEAISANNADILVAGWKTPALPRALPPRLRYVCYLCGSVKKLLARRHLETGLLVTNWGGSISRVVAEGALCLILSALRQSTYWTLAMHCRGEWKDSETETHSLFERRIGIQGFGLVARELVQLLRAFNPRITIHAPQLTDAEASRWQVHRAATLDELFSENDVIVALAPLTPATRGIIMEKHLRLIRPGGAFVNLARGALVDERALLCVASEGKINFALDVFHAEPLPPNHPLRALDNVTLTPHIAGPTTDRRRDAGAFAIKNLQAYLRGAPLEARITPEIFDASS